VWSVGGRELIGRGLRPEDLVTVSILDLRVTAHVAARMACLA
jgi:hypothetical protein